MQKSQARAGRNFSKPRTNFLADLCTAVLKINEKCSTTNYFGTTKDEFKEGCNQQRGLKRALYETTIHRATSILEPASPVIFQ